MPSARILIVEDERQTVDTLRDMFEQHGYETEVALNKQVALTILQERCMDIAIVSTSVQDSSGGDILHEIRKLNAKMPIIMISGQKSKRIESSSIKAGAKIFLLKPLDYVLVLQTIENLLEARFATAIQKKLRHTRKVRNKFHSRY
ncbi:MAG: response regulator [Candidatus Brocadiaceae bacterium]|nr:response regulator [Candidatus Brocadiaceae bacterium]